VIDKKLKNQIPFSFLEETNEQPQDDSPIFKFTTSGDAIDAEFVGRRHNVKTKTGEAIVLDVNILDSVVVGDQPVTGRHSIFESSHVSQIMDMAGLNPGDRFVLRLHNVNRKSRFKKFYFKQVGEAEVTNGNK